MQWVRVPNVIIAKDMDIWQGIALRLKEREKVRMEKVIMEKGILAKGIMGKVIMEKGSSMARDMNPRDMVKEPLKGQKAKEKAKERDSRDHAGVVESLDILQITAEGLAKSKKGMISAVSNLEEYGIYAL